LNLKIHLITQQDLQIGHGLLTLNLLDLKLLFTMKGDFSLLDEEKVQLESNKEDI